MSNDIVQKDIGNAVSIDDLSQGEKLSLELDEIKSNLIDVSDTTSNAIIEMAELAARSQNPMFYEALAKLITASAKVNKEAIVAVKVKSDIANITPSAPLSLNNTGEGNQQIIVTTTSDLVSQILNSRDNDSSN